MRATISKSDFSFLFAGSGHYQVTYTSPATFRTWTAIIHCMPLIDATKNADSPLKKDLEALKRLCKSH